MSKRVTHNFLWGLRPQSRPFLGNGEIPLLLYSNYEHPTSSCSSSASESLSSTLTPTSPSSSPFCTRRRTLGCKERGVAPLPPSCPCPSPTNRQPQTLIQLPPHHPWPHTCMCQREAQLGPPGSKTYAFGQAGPRQVLLALSFSFSFPGTHGSRFRSLPPLDRVYRNPERQVQCRVSGSVGPGWGLEVRKLAFPVSSQGPLMPLVRHHPLGALPYR